MPHESHALYPAAIGRAPIRRYTLALADAARGADFGTPVTTCGEWTLGDLIWHVAGVQYFWTHVIATRPAPPTSYEAPARPSDARLVANLRNAAVGLDASFDMAAPDEAAWSWSTDQTVGFSLRRQTHEALIHAIDGLLALEQPLPDVTPELAADGVDEMVRVMAEPTTDSGTIELHATDTDDRWSLNFGNGEASISGTALDLYLWLWGRAKTPTLAFTGDTDQATALRAKLASDTQ